MVEKTSVIVGVDTTVVVETAPLVAGAADTATDEYDDVDDVYDDDDVSADEAEANSKAGVVSLAFTNLSNAAAVFATSFRFALSFFHSNSSKF